MKAMVLEGAHQPLVLQDRNELTPGPGEAVVKLKVASLNHRDLWIKKGQYAGLKFPIVVGSDGVGEVSQVGNGVSAAWIGQSVVINPSLHWGNHESYQDPKSYEILGLPTDGTFAEYVKVPAENLYERPEHLTEEEAAAVPLAGVTAYRLVVHRGELRRDDVVLVNGVGSGVATFAVQIAVALGAKVFVTSSSEEKIQRAKEMGALGGANYNDPDSWEALRKEAGGFDLIVDSAGGEGFAKLIEIANPGGKIVLCGATRGNPPVLDSRRVYWKQLSILGSTMGSPSDFGAMLQMFEEHSIKPIIDKTFPLAEANEALGHMESGAQMGKILLQIS